MFGYNGYAGYGMMGGLGVWSFFGLLTWVFLIAFLVLGIAYFWKEINKPKGKR